MSRKPRNKAAEKEYALSQIKGYFLEADKASLMDPAQADRLVALARKTSMKYQITIPGDLKRRFCRNCYRYLRPGVNSRVRTSPSGMGRVILSCLDCGSHMRHPYVREKKAKRA